MEETEMQPREPSWFEQWFDSHYYHLLYKNRNDEEARFFIDNLVKKLSLKSGSKILDLACGKGRHAIYLNSLGFDVTGIDLAEDSINTAKKAENETLSFFVHDMRELYWADYFDAILNLFTSFGYFDEESDNLNTLQSVYDSLKPGGVFVIDYLNAAKASSELIAAEIITIDTIEFHISRKIKNDFIVKNIEVRDGDSVQLFMEKVQLLFPGNFQEYFTTIGFEIIEMWGDYSLNNFDIGSSERLIIVGRK